MRLHEGDGEHVHELSLDARGRLAETIWRVDNVELATVGIDIGSSTSHLMFARVRLQRQTQALSSRFVTVERELLWKSPILLTPFRRDGTIDREALGDFIDDCYRDAGLDPEAVDTGAVILTGEAIKRANARAIADLFATHSGRFVCATAGHHLECALAAHGSGAVALSRDGGGAILNVDIGGGTTKLALVLDGRVRATSAIAVGGRLLAFDDQGRLARIEDSARLAARHLGIALGGVGAKPSPADVDRIVRALTAAAIATLRGDPPEGLARELLLTEPLAATDAPRRLMFSGGVSEYLYGREQRDFGDVARALAAGIAQACASGAIALPVARPLEGIRATVIGAAQFTVQVSGKTIHLANEASLPLRNVPVLVPALELGGEVSALQVAHAVQESLERAGLEEDAALALALRWRGDPHHARLRALAEGFALAMAPRRGAAAPLVVMVDGDVARTLGRILQHELAFAREVVAIDGIRLEEFDFVDIGEVIRPADVVPVVIKSLLFSGAGARAGDVSFRPVHGSAAE